MSELETAVHAVVARLAHDLKNPLAVVLSNLRFLHEQLTEADLTEAAAESLLSAERAIRLIDGAVNIEELRLKKYRLNIESVALKELEEPLASALVPQQGKRKLHLELPLAVLRVDRSLLTQALIHLLEHALRQTPSGGTVSLRGEKRQDLLLEVMDGGLPFHPQSTPSLLTEHLILGPPSDSQWRSDQGMVLHFAGMAIRALGGSLRVNDRPDGQKGLVFQLLFPQALVE